MKTAKKQQTASARSMRTPPARRSIVASWTAGAASPDDHSTASRCGGGKEIESEAFSGGNHVMPVAIPESGRSDDSRSGVVGFGAFAHRLAGQASTAGW